MGESDSEFGFGMSDRFRIFFSFISVRLQVRRNYMSLQPNCETIGIITPKYQFERKKTRIDGPERNGSRTRGHMARQLLFHESPVRLLPDIPDNSLQ